jgi:hypothetical protein
MSATGPSAVVPAGSIPRLRFAVVDATRLEYAAVPTLRFALRIEADGEGRAIRSILLDVQVQIAARRRPYDARAHDRLFELFGPTAAWGTTLRTLQWTRATLVVPPFTGETVVDLPVVCTYDLDVAASRYLDALSDGDVPLEFLFSGTVFYSGPDGLLQTARIAWDQEAEYRLPVAVWKETMEHHFPGTAWVRLPKDDFDRLCAYKSRHALASWGDVLDRLLPSEDEEL